MNHESRSSHLLSGLLISALGIAVPTWGSESEIRRTPDGRPNLSGTYNVATLTPTERPAHLTDQEALSDQEAEAIARRAEATFDALGRASNPDREAPPVGGNVGGYNYFWLDPGSSSFRLDGEWRTSIITDPANGQMPPMTAEGRRLRESRMALWGRSSDPAKNLADRSDAWWLDRSDGPYDGPEIRPLGERCVLGFGSPAGPPVLPVVYNNLKRVVQTEDHLVILAEMVHDARIIRIAGQHDPQTPAKWLGDSVGRWDGDTLVVETRGFRPGLSPLSAPGLRQNLVTSAELRVVERFSRIDATSLRYQFTVEDPVVWSSPWGGEYPWPETDERVFEYACHEGNYAMGNILRGARLAEREARADTGGSR